MFIIRNNLFPLKGYTAMAVWPFVFVRRDVVLTDVVTNHERIHGRQQVECLWIPFFFIYGVCYVILLFVYWNHGEAYRHVPFEREAYGHQHEMGYLSRRKWWGWVSYL